MLTVAKEEVKSNKSGAGEVKWFCGPNCRH